MSRTWAQEAIHRIERDFQRSSDTHLLTVELPAMPQVQLYIKDESTHPTGSLKHRLARSLFLYALCNGQIGERTTIVEASSGSTAVSEAYFARMLGLPFVAVMPRSTSPTKIGLIEFYGGRCHFTDDPAQVYAEAQQVARDCDGHCMDQFTHAERATDWRGNNNIAESIFEQMADEPNAVPRWIVVGAGTGGTSATIGRYIRYQGHQTQLCVVDPERSVFYEYFQNRDATITIDRGSDIEGIGRPRVEPSFVPEVIDHMIRVPNAASYAGMRLLERLLGRRYGASTGTNFYGALQLACEMAEGGEAGSIVTLACDAGDRYLDTYYSSTWLGRNGYDLAPCEAPLQRAFGSGTWSRTPPGGVSARPVPAGASMATLP